MHFDPEGVTIHYQVIGVGTPVILIHGFTADFNYNWQAVAQILSADYQVIDNDPEALLCVLESLSDFAGLGSCDSTVFNGFSCGHSKLFKRYTSFVRYQKKLCRFS